MIRILLLLLAFGVTGFWSTNALAESPTNIPPNNGLQVQNPTRSFGYFIGDVLEQKINLDSASLLQPELVSEQRIDEYLYRLPGTIEIENEHTWFSIRYQIINAPPDRTTTVSLPAIVFKTKADGEITLPPWSFTLSALTTVESEQTQLSPVSDQSGLQLVHKKNSTGLKMGLAALLSTLLLWLLWWTIRHFRDAHTLPFAKARRIILKQPLKNRDTSSDSWVALHHAFNEVAGKTISTGSLNELYAAAPWLSSQQELIERFYKASSVKFFKGSESPERVPVDELSRALYRLEKRQAKHDKATAQVA